MPFCDRYLSKRHNHFFIVENLRLVELSSVFQGDMDIVGKTLRRLYMSITLHGVLLANPYEEMCSGEDE